jgi:hypothetical protein
VGVLSPYLDRHQGIATGTGQPRAGDFVFGGDMNPATLIQAGIAAADHWKHALIPPSSRTRVQEVPMGIRRWHVEWIPNRSFIPAIDFYGTPPSHFEYSRTASEDIILEKFAAREGEHIYMGYGSGSDLIVFWIPQEKD